MTGLRRRQAVTLGTILALLAAVVAVTLIGSAVAQEEVTVDVDASLSHAPGEETTVSLDLVDEDSGVVLGQATATVGPNATDAGDVTLTADFGESLADGDSLAVEAEATDGNTNYGTDAARVAQNVEAGEEYTVTGLELEAEPLTVRTDAELSASPGEETTVRFLLVVRNDAEAWAYIIDNTTTAVGPDETNTGEVTLAGDFANEHLNSSHDTSRAGDKLAIVVDAAEGNINYERYTIWGGHHLRPGHELDDRGEARLAAEPVTVNATAQLSHEPVEETSVSVELIETDSGTVVDNATEQVSTDETETGEVTLTGDFEHLDAGDTLAVVANGTHYEEGVVTVTDDLRPGETFDIHENLGLEAHNEAAFERRNIAVDETGTEGVVTVSVDIENVGDAPGSYDLSVAADGEPVFSDVRQELSPGEKVTDSVDLVLPGPGEYEIRVAEMDNAPQSRTVTVAGPPEGVRVAGYEVRETALLVDGTLDVEATVENEANEPASVDVPLLVDGSVVATETVDVGVNATEAVAFEWAADEPGAYDVTVGAQDWTAVSVGAERTLDDYMGADGTIGMTGVQAAITDWRAGATETDQLRDVIAVWMGQGPSSSGTAVVPV